MLALWSQDAAHGPEAIQDIGRFNEAIDQSIAESVDFFTAEVDSRRAVFLGVLGHDLRSPLNAILLTSHTISAMCDGTRVSPHTQRLVRSCERMARLLDDLLDYNRACLHVGVRVERARVDVAAVCREELDVLRAALPLSRIDLEATGDTWGRWDPSRVRQMVSNLVTNAEKYGEVGSVIRVRLVGDEEENLRLSVENTGRTIAKDLLRELFEPLRRHASAQAHGERESLGLGLYIVRQIAMAHGGEVTVESADRRTCFTVRLPRG